MMTQMCMCKPTCTGELGRMGTCCKRVAYTFTVVYLRWLEESLHSSMQGDGTYSFKKQLSLSVALGSNQDYGWDEWTERDRDCFSYCSSNQHFRLRTDSIQKYFIDLQREIQRKRLQNLIILSPNHILMPVWDIHTYTWDYVYGTKYFQLFLFTSY